MAKYTVRVKAGSSQEKVEEIDGVVMVWTRAKAHDGEANTAVVKALAEYFGVAKSRVRIWRGAAARNKIVEVLETE